MTKRVDQGPHPESRLVREEDELGEADDGESAFYIESSGTELWAHLEFAEYTSAQERVALGKKGRKAEAKKRREEMESLIADTYGDPLPVACASLTPWTRLEDDEEEKEWEQEQIRRAGHRDHTPETQIPVPQVYKPSLSP